MPNNLTDNETKKALELLLELVLVEGCLQRAKTISNALDLINRLQAENERLQAYHDDMESAIYQFREDHAKVKFFKKQIKTEAYKEFAEKSEIELYVKRNEHQKHWEEYLKQHNTTKDYQVHEWSVDNWLRGYGEAVQDIVSINDNLLKEKVGEDNARDIV